MKKDIHPKYVESTIACACGEVFQTRSTRKEIRVGVCAKCHPFFTGTQKYLDTAGRVEKFMKKYAVAKSPKKKKVRTLKEVEKPVKVKKIKAPAAATAPAAQAPEPVVPVTEPQAPAPVTETQAPAAE